MQRIVVERETAGVMRDVLCRLLPSSGGGAVIIIQFKYFHAVLYHYCFVDCLLISVNWQGLLNCVEGPVAYSSQEAYLLSKALSSLVSRVRHC